MSTASAMTSGVRSVRPLRIQSRRPGPATLVAMNKRSRCWRASQVPRYFSVRPCVLAFGGTGYISAVSMKLMPCTDRVVELLVRLGLAVLLAPGHGAEADRETFMSVPGRILNCITGSGSETRALA